MITDFKIYEGFLSKNKITIADQFLLDVIKIFTDINKDILNHVKVRHIYILYDSSIVFEILYKYSYDIKYNNIILDEIYKDENLKNERPPLNYNKMLDILKRDVTKMYNLDYTKFLSKYLKKCFEMNILFFSQEIFNNNFDKYVIDYNEIMIEYFYVYKDILSKENMNKYNHLINANKFDLI